MFCYSSTHTHTDTHRHTRTHSMWLKAGLYIEGTCGSLIFLWEIYHKRRQPHSYALCVCGHIIRSYNRCLPQGPQSTFKDLYQWVSWYHLQIYPAFVYLKNMFSHVQTFTNLNFHSILRVAPPSSLCHPLSHPSWQWILKYTLGIHLWYLLTYTVYSNFGVSVCSWHDLYWLVLAGCTLMQPLLVSVWAVSSAACFCLCVYVLCVCVFITVCVCVTRNKGSKLTQWQFLAKRQRGPAIQQQRLCRSAPLGLLGTSFSLFLLLSLPFLVSPFSCLKS